MLRKFSIVLIAAIFVIGFVVPSYASDKVKQVLVSGAKRVETETILTYLDIRAGDDINQDMLNKGLKNLFATGLFADVVIKNKGNGYIEVAVVENPVINRIAFEGNRKIEDEELASEIVLRQRQVLTRTKVQNDVSRLYQLYRRNGRFSVSIEPEIIKLDQNRVDLVFVINEGAVTKVSSIRFIGNKKFDDERLRKEISTKEARWYRFISNDDRYDPDRMEYDKELLRRHYLRNGYADFRIENAVAELSPDKSRFYMTYSLYEGKRYKVGKIHINSKIKYFDANVLKEYVDLSSGEWYNADKVQSTINKMSDVMGDMQFAFVNIRPDIHKNKEEGTVDIVFNINETPRVFVEKINIRGNVRTMDKVIRREMLLNEGDPYSKSKLARSEQAIKDLGYFENVNMDILSGSAPDKTVVDIDVTEQSTGEISFGAGLSTSDGPLADIRFRERNFLGKGQNINLGATVAGKRTEFNFSFTEPYFMNRDISVGTDLFRVTRNLQKESSFDQERVGGGLRVGYPLSEYWRQNLGYRIESNDIRNVQSNASRFIREQAGKRTTSAISQGVTFDNRDSVFFPTKGQRFWLDTEVSGLGGDSQYVSAKVGISHYYPIADNWIFNSLGEIGVIEGYGGESVAINERFYLGGNSLRGFQRSGVGPRDTVTDDSLGGNRYYRGSFELSMPVGLPDELGVKGHLFTDFGSLWGLDDASGFNIVDDSSIRAAAGVGVSWRSPFGPIRIDYALPYADEEYDSKESFRFSFGTRF